MTAMQTSFFLKFQESNPLVDIGQSSFEYLKPFFVKPLKNRNTCCCIYHVELEELRVALNNMYKSKNVCFHSPLLQTIDFQSSVKPAYNFDPAIHVPGECDKCGVENLFKFCENELEGSESALADWRRFSSEETISKKGKS